MFWAAFGHGIRTELIPMKGDPLSARGGVTARIYEDILNRYLPSIIGPGNIFMQDNASIHRAYIIRDWFRDHNIELIDWPPYSPDLNLIENL